MNPTSCTSTPNSDTDHQGATAIISHQIKPEYHAIYGAALDKVALSARTFTGFIDRHVIVPITGKTKTFTVILRYDNAEHLQAWFQSAQRRELIAEVKPYLISNDDYHVQSGLEFLFQQQPVSTPNLVQVTPPKPPKSWKQFLLTWSAIFPLVVMIFWLYELVTSAVNIHPQPLLAKLIITGLVVFMMVYVVMPRYTKLVKNWLLS